MTLSIRHTRPPIQHVPRPRKGTRGWPTVTGLIVLSLVPALAGGLRLTELASGAAITPENSRFFDSPVPVVIHVVAAILYSMIGAFQFPRALRQRRRSWHRRAGWALGPSGLAVALSGLWMTAFYDLPATDDLLLAIFRMSFGTGMALSVVLGMAAAVRRDFRAHGAWMIRAYAIGLAAGTQVLTAGLLMTALGLSGASARAWLMGAGWMINLAVGEWVIRRNVHGRRAVAARA